MSSQPKGDPSEQDKHQTDSDRVFYSEVDMSDLPSQYTEEIEPFRHILKLPDPRDTMARSSTTLLGLDDEKANRSLGQVLKSLSQRCL